MAGARRNDILLRIVARVADATPHRVKTLVARAAGRSRPFRRLLALVHGDLRDEDVTIAMGAAAGMRFNSADSVCGYTHGTTEPVVQQALQRELSEGQVAYDIGANIGFFTIIAARQVGSRGKVVAFDPLPENIRWLQHNADLNDLGQIEAVEAAVGAEHGTARVQRGATAVWAHVSETGDDVVRLVGIDAGIADGSLPVPDLVKIDIEGAEVAALDGMRETLARHRPTLIVELHETMAPVVERLTAAGYDFERLDPREPDANAHLLARHRG
jgi:FkbM family methyltransferase